MDKNKDEAPKERSCVEVEKMLSLAKINPDDLLPTSQTVYFGSQDIYDKDYKILELNPHILETLDHGDTIYIKGDLDENAVMCTESRTYELVEAETSNSMLLVENLKFKTDLESESQENNRSISKVFVFGTFHSYLEVVPSKPHFQKLYDLLDRSLYKGPEYEYEIDETNLFSYDELLNKVQASKKELDALLQTLPIVRVNDKIRKLDFEYHFRILSYMLKVIDEYSWALDQIDYDETINALTDLVPMEILNGLFDLYTEQTKIIDGLQLYRYKETDVCRFFARVLLFNAKKFNFTEFLQAWTESVPEGMAPSEEMLYGIAIVNKDFIPYTIRAFDEDKLPDNIIERFKVLFDAKEKWTTLEITPYIQRLTTEKTDVSAFLAKYTRVSTVKGVKYYSSKHGK